jgi:hypothetical protein
VKIFCEISQEFCDNVATEKWIMKGGMLRIEGESVDTSKAGDKSNVAMVSICHKYGGWSY